MAVQNRIQEDESKPVVYLIGSEMDTATLKSLGDQIDAAVNESAAVALISLETEEGTELTERYEIDSEKIPAVIITEDDESYYKGWYGDNLPEAEAVIYEIDHMTGSIDL
jgi:ribonucleotide monophosphatase NagD (HAD superfamily)